MPVVLLGHEDGQVTRIPNLPDVDDSAWTDKERFNAITHDDGVNEGIWARHRGLSNSRIPAWVASDDAELAQRLADHYGCPVGAPAGEEVVDDGQD